MTELLVITRVAAVPALSTAEPGSLIQLDETAVD